MCSYKDLPLKQDQLEVNVNSFIEQNGLRIEKWTDRAQGSITVRRVTFGVPGKDATLVDFYLNSDGTTTIVYSLGKQGQNRLVGEQLAVFMKSTIDPHEFETVELTLVNILRKDIQPVFEKFEDDNDRFNLEIKADEPNVYHICIQSIAHKDKLTIKHFPTTNKLQIQGKPLFCYRTLTYHLTDLLDMWCLEKVLSRRDESRTEVVRPEVATGLLKAALPDAFELLPTKIKQLLVSGLCISVASPDLPDYSMLLYPDLRALEGAILDCLASYGLYPSNFTTDRNPRVGILYSSSKMGYSLKQEHKDIIVDHDMIEALEEAYNTYHGKRHPLFHMDEIVHTSTLMPDIKIATEVSMDIKECINDLYKNKP